MSQSAVGSWRVEGRSSFRAAQRFAGYQENGKRPEWADKGVVRSDEGCGRKIDEGVL